MRVLEPLRELTILAHPERWLATFQKNFRLRIEPKLFSTAHKVLGELSTPSWEDPQRVSQHATPSAAMMMAPSYHWVFAHALHAWHASPHLVCQTNPYPP